MEKQGEVRPDITPAEDPTQKRASADVKSVDKLAEEHITSRLIGSVGPVTQKPAPVKKGLMPPPPSSKKRGPGPEGPPKKY